MRKYTYNEITFMQYIMLIHGAQLGVGILQLPRELAEKAGTDGWISIVLGWAMSIVASLIIIRIMQKNPDATLLDAFGVYFGKWGKIGGGVILIAYFGFLTFIIMARSLLFIKTWILPRTPDVMIMLLFAIPTYLIARNGLRVLGRYAELTFYLFLSMAFVFFIPWGEAHWHYLLPVVKEGWKPILLAAQTTVVSFLGFEVAFFLYPFLQKKHLAPAGIVIANTISMCIFLLITISCFTFFSPEGILWFMQPTLNLLKVVEFQFIERLEIVLLAFYLFVVFRVWASYLFWTVYCTTQLRGKEDHRLDLKLYLLGMVLYPLIFNFTFTQNDNLQKLYGMLGIIFAFVLPVVLWLYTCGYDYVQRRRTG
ncbi:endospore germination permease [Paenibacillus sp. NPDC056579]|uniref:GerAB/ArcD/ProY family transporter n=1 Tax=Paenibacillus sp. NPDC056579 TaxID=3345871 RepID=UPI0036A4587F